MPLFDYQCKHCNHMFEELSSINEVILCPKCNTICKRLISNLSNYTGIKTKFVDSKLDRIGASKFKD